jgi:hypothetical protein
MPPIDYTPEEIELAKGLHAIGVGAVFAAHGSDRKPDWEATSEDNRIGLLAIARHVIAQSAKHPSTKGQS